MAPRLGTTGLDNQQNKCCVLLKFIFCSVKPISQQSYHSISWISKVFDEGSNSNVDFSIFVNIGNFAFLTNPVQYDNSFVILIHCGFCLCSTLHTSLKWNMWLSNTNSLLHSLRDQFIIVFGHNFPATNVRWPNIQRKLKKCTFFFGG